MWGNFNGVNTLHEKVYIDVASLVTSIAKRNEHDYL